MGDRDQLLDGASIPWDFINGSEEPVTATLPPRTARTQTPSQTIRRRLIAAVRWERP